jgi:Kdo2-lipid IVA lauroyltransferase/acyltransferase
VTGTPDAPQWHASGLNNGPIVGATYYGVSHLPTWLTYRIGHVGTWVAYHLMRQGTNALLENFAVMFPEMNLRERKALALRTYRSYARDVIDFIRSLRMTPDATRRLVTRFETSALEQAMSEGRGAILLSGHFGNWEIGGVLLRHLTPYALSVVARSEASPAVQRLRLQMRTTFGVETIEVRQHLETALRIRARLQKNEAVAMLLDRHFGKDYVEVSFFGRRTGFLRTPALLAALTGAPLVPCFIYRERGGLAVECGPLIRVSSEGDRDGNVREAIQATATLIEAYGRRHPQYWYQFYPVWSTQHSPAAARPPSSHPA